MEKYYVLERFALMKSSVISAVDTMRLKRVAVEKSRLRQLLSFTNKP